MPRLLHARGRDLWQAGTATYERTTREFLSSRSHTRTLRRGIPTPYPRCGGGLHAILARLTACWNAAMNDRPPDSRRYTVREAADVLGISAGAVRNRISRGTLRNVREGGRVFVLLADDEPQSTTGLQSADNALISELRDQIKYLREENRRKDHLLAAALERIPPQLEAPEPESEESPTPEQRGFWSRLFRG
jgi:excisionase family DNA binding protein